jgi:hypothetical protein
MMEQASWNKDEAEQENRGAVIPGVTVRAGAIVVG